ncbi:unnamed protein product [Citrullus colocynthis]|uniref:Uncharacterized protein n=1 Tax=Citrullus colocynthis TaxID=252529 RepID=A0ABP0XS65_9ROSI
MVFPVNDVEGFDWSRSETNRFLLDFPPSKKKKKNPKKLNPLPLGLPWFFPHLSTIYFNPYPSRFTHRR